MLHDFDTNVLGKNLKSKQLIGKNLIMSKIVSRLKEYIDSKGISISAFEKSIGMSNASFGRSLKTNGAIGTDKLEKILNEYPDINLSWLMTGQGEMLVELPNEEKDQGDSQNIMSIGEQAEGVNSISQRIEILVQYFAEGNNSKFASLIGTSEANIRNYITGTQPKFEFLSAVAMKFKINYDWLLTGRGGMLYGDSVGKNDELKIGGVSCQHAYLVEKEAREGVLVAENKRMYNADTVQIPIVDIAVAAGTGCFNSDSIEVMDRISLPESMIKPGVQYLCVRVKGESMAPTLLDSSFLVIRLLMRAEWEHLHDEQIYVVSDVEGKAYVKRIKNRFKKGFVVCMSDNPDKAYYPNFNLQENEINTLWYSEWYISAKMPNIHQTYYNKVSELEDDIADIKNSLKKINLQLGVRN